MCAGASEVDVRDSSPTRDDASQAFCREVHRGSSVGGLAQRVASCSTIALTNLANAHGDLGNQKTKRDMLLRTLRIKEAHYGEDLPGFTLLLSGGCPRQRVLMPARCVRHTWACGIQILDPPRKTCH